MAVITTAIVLLGYFAFFSVQAWSQNDGATLKAKLPPAGAAVVDNNSERSAQYITGYNLDQSDLEGEHVIAHLDTMQLDLVLDGQIIQSVPIISKGKPGSAWETPAGSYQIKTKIRNHFSSIGEVYMPYSMQFFGNFFIHGWPYYPNGTEVEEGYSGGCIRLTTEDAQAVFDFVQPDTPVHVITTAAEVIPANTTARYGIQDFRLPLVSAAAYVVADLDSGEVLIEKNQHAVRPIASLTKLMTALVSLEILNQFQTAAVSQTAHQTYGGQGDLQPGQRLPVKDLLYPLLLNSSNDAAEVIAEHQNRNYFLNSMNQRAKSIGLENTHFEDPSGLSAQNISTAADMFKLTRYLWQDKKYVLDLTRQKQFTGQTGQTWNLSSRFKNDLDYLGGKNGYIDESGHTLIAIFKAPLAEFEDRNIAIVLLRSNNKEEDARDLLRYVSENTFYTPDLNTPQIDLSALRQ